MDDMISRQAAIDALDKVAEMFPYRIPGKTKTYRQYNEAWSDAIDAAENALEALPSAQPEIVRCKDCKEFRRWIDTDITFCDCTEYEVKADDFCSKAERRTDG